MLTRFLLPLGAALTLLLAVGCGKSGGQAGHKVTGKVTLDGQPVAGAKVIFSDGKESKGFVPGPSAITDESGQYTLVSVPPGTYKVVVYKFKAKGGAKLPGEGEGMDMTQLEMSGQGEHVLPKKYLSPSTTNLTATVQGGENKDVDFNLTAK